MISLSVSLLATIFCLQAQFNDYKYIVVPTKFPKFNNENQYQTSTLTKYHISQHGFNVIYDNAIPTELKENRCLALWVDLVEKSSLFATRVQLNFKDCYGDSVFITAEGRTKIKDYKGAYAAAIAQAAASLKGKEYNYVEKEKKKAVNTADTAITQTPLPEPVEKPTGVATEAIQKTTVEVAAEPAEKEAVVKETVLHTETNELLYAQPTPNGYQLVDTKPSVRYVLEATSVDDVFLVNQEGINGVVLKKEDKWYLEYKGPNGKVSKELFIKF